MLLPDESSRNRQLEEPIRQMDGPEFNGPHLRLTALPLLPRDLTK
jgi:hypothetical protein